MEKRIKALYIITICAILAFIGMQVYWLYSRYEYSISEYENDAEQTVTDLFSQYMKNRSEDEFDSVADTRTMVNYNINDVKKNDTLNRVATITIRRFKPLMLLGIKGDRELTDEENKLASSLAMDDPKGVTKIRHSIAVNDAPSEGAIWGAFKNMSMEYWNNLKADKVDSILAKNGIDASTRLIVTDSIPWRTILKRHSSVISPTMTISIPYSEMERKVAEITCRIHPAEVLGKMASNLIVVAVLSIVLILCLIWQFSTILKMSKLDKMRNNFVTTMVHELKRPISTLKMCVSGIENPKLMEQPEVKREIVAETRTALDNLSSYFSKLRDLTFNNVEQIPLNWSRFNLHDLFAELEKEARVPSDKSVEFDNRIDPETVMYADRTHMANILMNLVENAIKYSGSSVMIVAQATVDKDMITVSVSDNGNGISPHDIPHVFSRFYRGKATSSDLPGMGLGLTYVKLLVDAHGGQISLESHENKGSIFTISIPQ